MNEIELLLNIKGASIKLTDALKIYNRTMQISDLKKTQEFQSKLNICLNKHKRFIDSLELINQTFIPF